MKCQICHIKQTSLPSLVIIHYLIRMRMLDYSKKEYEPTPENRTSQFNRKV